MRVFIAGCWGILCPEFSNFKWISQKIYDETGRSGGKGNMECWSCICFLCDLAILLRHQLAMLGNIDCCIKIIFVFFILNVRTDNSPYVYLIEVVLRFRTELLKRVLG